MRALAYSPNPLFLGFCLGLGLGLGSGLGSGLGLSLGLGLGLERRVSFGVGAPWGVDYILSKGATCSTSAF